MPDSPKEPKKPIGVTHQDIAVLLKKAIDCVISLKDKLTVFVELHMSSLQKLTAKNAKAFINIAILLCGLCSKKIFLQ